DTTTHSSTPTRNREMSPYSRDIRVSQVSGSPWICSSEPSIGRPCGPGIVAVARCATGTSWVPIGALAGTGRSLRARVPSAGGAMADPDRRKPKQERALATFDAVIEAAARILVEDGYAKLTTNRVAERAGVSVGTLYQYFRSKEQIIE